jgi:8-oxo-dGTP diphosphatase
MNLKVDIGKHLYTTDYFQMSAFNPDHQIISIYYMVKPLEEITARLSSDPFDFDEQQLATYNLHKETESFRFIDWNNLSEDSVTLPIDKIVVTMLKQRSN